MCVCEREREFKRILHTGGSRASPVSTRLRISNAYLARETQGHLLLYAGGIPLPAGERRGQGVDPDTEGQRRQGKEKV